MVQIAGINSNFITILYGVIGGSLTYFIIYGISGLLNTKNLYVLFAVLTLFVALWSLAVYPYNISAPGFGVDNAIIEFIISLCFTYLYYTSYTSSVIKPNSQTGGKRKH
jgi:hypothetical protein